MLAVTVAAQINNAPRLTNPDLTPPERAEDINKRLDPVYDNAKDETTFFLSGVYVVLMGPGHEVVIPGELGKKTLPSSVVKMVAYYRFKGKNNRPPGKVTIAFSAGSAFGYSFGDERKLTVNAGSEKLALGDMDLTGRRYDGFKPYGYITYWETLEMPIDVDLYKKIINSNTVSMQLGESVLSLSDAQLKQLRTIATKYLK